MKKLIFYCLALVIMVTGCAKKESFIFSESPDQRLNKTLTDLQSKLSGSTTGWLGVLELQGSNKGTASYHFQFDNNNRVKMVSDFGGAAASTMKESSYRLKALQQPTLIFDTYSYIHILADPAPSIAGGKPGKGFESDFEFAYDPTISSTDTLKFFGRFNGSKLMLIRSSQADATAAAATGFIGAFINLRTNYNKLLTYWKRFTHEGTEYELNLNFSRQEVVISYLKGTELVTQSANTFITPGGTLHLVPPATITLKGGKQINTFSNFSWNNASSKLSLSINGTTVNITESIVALKNDVSMPYKWWNLSSNPGRYFASLEGFHVNGVDDFFKVRQISNWWYMLYWSKYNAAGYDAFSGVVNGSIVGFAVHTPPVPPATSTNSNFTPDGRIIFTYFGRFGTTNSAFPILGSTAMRNLVTEPQGFYLVQTGLEEYDMVSANDAKSWISWSLF